MAVTPTTQKCIEMGIDINSILKYIYVFFLLLASIYSIHIDFCNFLFFVFKMSLPLATKERDQHLLNLQLVSSMQHSYCT